MMIHPRLDWDLHVRVTQFARQTDRTLNGAVTHLLKTALDIVSLSDNDNDTH